MELENSIFGLAGAGPIENLSVERKIIEYVEFEIKKQYTSMENFISTNNIILEYINEVSYHCTFKAYCNDRPEKLFTVQITPFTHKTDTYGKIHDAHRPENAELFILKSLHNVSKHIISPIGYFNTNTSYIVSNCSKWEKYHKDFDDTSSVLLFEWCDSGDALNYVRSNYQTMTLIDWKVIFFQILSTLATIQEKYPSFRHNDLKFNNILLSKTDIINNNDNYIVDNIEFRVPNIGLHIKISRFDFASIDGLVENNKTNAKWTKVIGISKNKNRYFDMHYLFNTFMNKRFFPHFSSGGVPTEIVDFINRIIPPEYRQGSNKINERGRLLVEVEYTTPFVTITTDPLFQDFMCNKE